MNRSLFIVIPALNEAKIITSVISGIFDLGYKNIIVVDDGSDDDTAGAARTAGAIVCRHVVNRGKGAAMKTGIEMALIKGAEIVVTMDGDGQHSPGDVKRMEDLMIRADYDVILGSRPYDIRMPIGKVIANYLANFLTFILSGIWVSDSQSGFRAFTAEALKVFSNLGDKYEYDTEIIKEISANKLKFAELPIEVRYTDYSMQKVHKQGFINGVKTVYRLIWNMIS